MITLSDSTIKKSLSERILRLYLVAGNDAFLLDGCVRTIVRAAQGESGDELLRFSQKQLCDGAFLELFTSISMLGQTRVAIVEDFSVTTLSAAARELLLEWLPHIPDDLVVIFKSYGDDRRYSVPKKALELMATCPESAAVTAMAKQGGELERYVDRMAVREGCTIDGAAVRALILLCGDDLLLLSNEIKKMAALCGYKNITTAEVDALGIRTAEAGVYKMINAIESGNVKTALALLRDMLDDLTEPLAITAALGTSFVNLYRAALVRAGGHNLQYMMDHFHYKKGDRPAAIAFERCGRYSIAKLEKAVGIVYELDGKLKSSALDTRVVLEQHVAMLALAVGA